MSFLWPLWQERYSTLYKKLTHEPWRQWNAYGILKNDNYWSKEGAILGEISAKKVDVKLQMDYYLLSFIKETGKIKDISTKTKNHNYKAGVSRRLQNKNIWINRKSKN